MSDGFQYKNHNIFIQDAYIADDGLHYEAFGTSIDENEIEWEFKLIWKIKDSHINNFDETDESNACNWDEFEVIELGEALK